MTELLIDPLNLIALLWFIGCWFGYALFADIRSKGNVNLLDVMNDYRKLWMRQMLKRDNRMMDATIIGNLLRSISFFANTTIFLLIGLISMLGYHDKAMEILQAIPFAAESSALLWEIKIFLLCIIFIYAFFKYTWSLRQYNYACVVVGAAPLHTENREHHEDFADKAGKMIGNAAKHFNMGLRAYYFGLAALSWFINPWFFIAATAWVVLVLYRREFRSHTLNNLAQAAAAKHVAPQ